MSKKHLAGVIAAMLAAPWAAAAEEEATHIETREITVTGILPERLEAVPGSFDIVDTEDLAERRPFSIKEALNQVPGVNVVDEDTFGLGVNIGVRGMDPRRTARTLLLEDGMPLFLAPYSDPAAHYTPPLERVQRIEVVKGSGQVLYGPQTVGGMINFVTRPVPKDGFTGSVAATLGNNNFHGLHASLGVGGERGGIVLDALQKKGDGVREHHDFDVREFTLKGQLNINERHTLIAKAGYYEEGSHVSETGLGEVEYHQDKFQAGSGKNDKFEQERQTFQLQHIFQISERAKLSTQAYHVDQERASFRQVDAPGRFDDEDPGLSTGISQLDRCSGLDVTEANAAACGGRWRPREYEYWGIEPRLDFSHTLFGIENDAVIGFRYHEEDITRHQYRDASPLAQTLGWAEAFGTHREHVQIDVEAKSYYAQNTFHVGDWSLTPGIRVEDIKIKTDVIRADGGTHDNPESVLTNEFTEVLPGFGVAWNGIANTTVFAGVHKGFAPPRPDRDIRTGGAADSAVVDETDPEISINWELGVRSSYFKGITFESTLFHTKLDDIVIKSDGGTYINGGEARMSGVEFAGRIDFGTVYNTPHNFYITASYTNLFRAEFTRDGEDPEDGIVSGERLPYAPHNMAAISFGYQHPLGIDARIGVDYVGSQKPDAWTRVLHPVDAALSGLSGDIPSRTLLNASISYKPQGSGATFFLSGHNLANKEYLASRVDGMVAGRERQVFGGVRYDF